MILTFGKYIVLLFGIYIIFISFLMLFAPKKARMILRKAGSTNFINYSEITLRFILAIAIIFYSDFTKFPEPFKMLGWFMLITSLILYFVPRRIHHNFSMKSADRLKPIYFRLISPLAFLFGGLIIYNTL